MDPTLLLLLGIGFVAPLVGSTWRRSSGAKTPEEHLEQAALKAEQDRNRTEATYQADRYNVRD